MRQFQFMKHYQSNPLKLLLKLIFLLHHLPSPHDALSFTYTNFLSTQNLTFSGDAFPYRGILSVTKDGADSSVGRVTYAPEFHLWDHATKWVANFSTEFSFNITSQDQDNGGDGMAFFLTANGAQIPDASAGACLGLISHCDLYNPQEKPIVDVEIDTFKNPWDPDSNHIGINVNSIRSEANFSWPSTLKDGSILKMRINYDAQKKSLDVYMSPQGDPFPGQPNLSYDIDLSETLPEWINIGFSGSTGAAMELHYIQSWDFQSSEVIVPLPAPAPVPAASRPRRCVPWPSNCSGAGHWFLFVLFVVGVIFGAFVVLLLFHAVFLVITGKEISWRKIFGIIPSILGIIAGVFGLLSCTET